MYCLLLQLCGLCFLSGLSLNTCSDVFTSIDHLDRLNEAEGYMQQAVKDYIEDEEDRLDILENLLEKIENVHDRDEAKDPYTFVGHPLNAFNLLKRYTLDWSRIFEAFDEVQHKEPLKLIADDFNAYLPHGSDYDGALAALLRLQKIYGLSVQDLSEGWVFHKRAAPLGHEHMFDVGVAALNQMHNFELGEEWMRTARNVERPPIANLNTVDEEYRKLRDYNKQQKENPTPPVEEPVSNVKYQELCRESMYKPYVAPRSHLLYCYMHSYTLIYYSFKVELLHTDPEVAMIYDFVSEKEAAVTMDRGGHIMTRARVGIDGEAATSNVRVGKVAFLWDQKHKLIDSISKRASYLTGLNTTYPTGEPLQVVNYGMGGQYEVHYDFDIHRAERKEESPEMKLVGDRIATLMIYLNDVEAGGATVFPEFDFYVRPVARAGLFWFNYDLAGVGNPRTLHAGCPVALGQKWIANKWIRQYGQELYRPCRVDEDITVEMVA